MGMAYWLLKSEPGKYGWDQLVADGRTPWDGVRNAQALINLRAMQRGDRAFFYHSNEGREIVGIVEVAKTFYPDPNDASGKLGMVDVKPVMSVARRVALAAMKAEPALAGLSLLRQSRLSVCPVSPREWAILCGMAGVAP
jgi:predicted RNA-binding protein with PUA-like domain